MTGYIARRILATIPVLLMVTIFVFVLLRVALPGDPAALLAGPDAQIYEIEEVREHLGLNRPVVVQLGIWLGDIAQGDFGTSTYGKHKVLDLIKDRMVATISLAISAELLMVGMGIPLGVFAGWKARSLTDRSVMVLAVLGYSVPVFWLGLMLIYLFAVRLDWVPAAGYVPPSEDFKDYVMHLILPVITTAVIGMALMTRMTRATMVETLNENYIRTARAKGMAEKVVLLRHGLKNAALPIVTIIGLGFAGLLTGLVITESVFAIPGLGRLLVSAISERNYPVIQGTALFISVVYVLVNLLVDLSYGLLDPRIRY
jgi:peptide/nickel transport system permease protein